MLLLPPMRMLSHPLRSGFLFPLSWLPPPPPAKLKTQQAMRQQHIHTYSSPRTLKHPWRLCFPSGPCPALFPEKNIICGLKFSVLAD